MAPVPGTTKTKAEQREGIIRRILQRELSGASLKATVVKREDHDLFVDVTRCFRIWCKALRTAGINVEAVTGKRAWTADRVVREIRDMGRRGTALNHASARRVDQGLLQAARKLWGSWENALQAAGYDPATIRRGRSPWTKSEIISVIQANAAGQLPVWQHVLITPSIIMAVRQLFGSPRVALQRAGVLHLVKRRHRWSRTVIIKAIRERNRAGESLSCAAVMKSTPGLYDAARQYFGGWGQALRAAGFDPSLIREKHAPWTPQDVLEEIRRRAKVGESATCISSIRPISLVNACQRFFGSWRDAVRAAKLRPMKANHRPVAGHNRRLFEVRGCTHDG